MATREEHGRTVGHRVRVFYLEDGLGNSEIEELTQHLQEYEGQANLQARIAVTTVRDEDFRKLWLFLIQGLKPRVKSHNFQLRLIQLDCGSEIKFMSGTKHRINHWRGREWTCVWFFDKLECDVEVYSVGIQYCRVGPNPLILETV